MSQPDFDEFVVNVDNPQKHFDPLETYVTFRVTTKVNADLDKTEEYVVRRRYSDFLWLRNKLIESFPTLVVPALPAKHSVIEQLDRYSRPFILSRMAMLHSYLQRLTGHPVFSCCPTLKVFLTAKSSEFTMRSKVSPGILDRLTGSLPFLTGISARRAASNPEFKSIKTYVNNLGQKLTAIQSVNLKVYKERLELQVELEDAKRALNQWANLETDLSGEILSIATALETVSTSQQNNLLNGHTSNLSQPLDEYLNYVEAVKEALLRRDAIEFLYYSMVEELARKRREKEELESMDNSSTGFGFKLWKATNRDRIRRLQQDLPSLEQVVEDHHDKMEIANESIKSDLDRWNVEKVTEMKNILESMTDQHVLFYQDCLKAWETALETLKQGTLDKVDQH
ncbi:Hypothetical protein NTJ_06627 [Nesidiocoris tenuis]|uniref:PX domain-containing protein n=1 Tax=Nesidiocoris tenuis TaxID=355587 RepID=A0ABN7APB6_9HEMI|nr:Hypothetical protein NTJ_06627 [Nesidiocoris tenuis]